MATSMRKFGKHMMGNKSKKTDKTPVLKKKKPVKDNKISLALQDITDLGGTKEDLSLLHDVDEASKSDDEYEEATGVETFDEKELHKFIGQLKFKKTHSGQEKEGVSKPKKEKSRNENTKKKNMDTSQSSPDNIAPGNIAPQVPAKKSKNKNKWITDDSNSATSAAKKLKKTNGVQDPLVSSSTVARLNPVTSLHSHKQQRKYLLVKPGTKWHEDQFQADPLVWEPAPAHVVKTLQTLAERLLQDEVNLYNQMRAKKKRGETHWMKTVISSGTLADRMAALTLLLQDAPVHNHITIDMLVGMANKKGRRESIMALDTIRDLVLSELLPDGCKLKCFDQHPLLCLDELSSGNRDVADRRLIIYQFEHQLKQQYANLVETLKKLSFDNLKAVKTKALRTAYDLLINKPEQEKELLSILVNKLGDPDRKVAANCCHLLGQLVDHHPNMKSVVVLEVERVLYRQNISSKAQYYGMCFLNQLVLDRQEGDLASRLISLYFSFFQSIVKKGEVDSKMLSALLTGVNRAFPYTKKNSEKVVEQVNMLYKIVHVSNFNISIQALMLLHQLLDANENLSDRFYTVLYKKLSEPGLKTSSKQMMFLNLVFKSMLKDVVVKRLQAFLKRLLQISAYQAPNFICGVLLLVSELLKKRPGTLSLKAPCSFEDDDEEEKFMDVDIAENEDNPADVKVAAISQPGSDVDDKSPVLPAIEQQEASEKVAQKPNASWVHKRNIQGRVLQLQDYDAYQRNPQYAGAEYTCMWELVKMAHHFHPSVGLFARDVISGKGVSYSGDPLQDFTLIRFLDRFVYRNPKKTNKGETADVMVMRAKKQTRGLGEGKAVPVNTAEFLKRGEANTPVDEQFLYRYFSKKADQKKDLDNVSEGESISDDEFDKLLDKIEPGSRARDDFDMDFASEYSKKLKQLKKQKAEAELSESNDDDDDDDDVDFGEDFMDDFQDSDLDELQKGGAEMEFNEEDVAFSDDDGLFVPKKSSKRDATDGGYPMPSMKKKRKKDENLFAAAEQFASIMDDNAGSKVDTSGSEALANKDKADAKQLKWEMNRHRWEEGRDWKSKKRGMRGARGRQLGKSSRQGHKKVFQNKRK